MTTSWWSIVPKVAPIFLAAVIGQACSSRGNTGAQGTTPEDHPAFPVGPGSAHAIGRVLGDSVIICESCHTSGASVPKEFSCIGCHQHTQAITDRLHLREPLYSYASTGCYSCHASGTKGAFDHAGITDGCAMCHDRDKPYAALPSAQTEHRPIGALDCSACHVVSPTTDGTWAGGRFHTPASSYPVTCLPCHEREAPTSTAGWRSPEYDRSPFDYGTNALGIAHGGAQDCEICHSGGSTGASGDQVSWVGGHFSHGRFTLADKTCIACHVSQRPDLQPGATAETAAAQVGFDHSRVAAMDCISCHSATAAAGTYVNYVNPVTSTLPGGDWQGGQSYPGSTPVTFIGEHLGFQVTTLDFSDTNDFVTSATMAWQARYLYMVHASGMIPAEVRPGPASEPDYGKCWHCHSSSGGKVTGFFMGKFHKALAHYQVTPEASSVPLPQPSRGCKDCHAASQPSGIVSPTALQPMDHGIAFASPVIVAGVSATKVSDLDCSTCHHDPGGTFGDGLFHGNIPGTALRDCVSCHYVTMAEGSIADAASSASYHMKHNSAQVTFHTCSTCHPSALPNAITPAVAPEAWKPGQYHAVLSMQPTACRDCHEVSLPAPDTLPAHSGLATSTGGPDCGDCHTFPGTGTPTKPNWQGAATKPL